MPKALPFHLHSLNVVITAAQHNPSILNPDFLRLNKIIPAKWEYTENITTPALSKVSYENGVNFMVEPNKMTISEPSDGTFGGRTRVHQIAQKYVTRLPYVPYRAIGLNCRVWKPTSDAAGWLKSRFLKLGKWSSEILDVQEATIKLHLNADGAKCILTMQPAEVQPTGGDPTDSVLIDCNFHHDGPFTIKQMKGILQSWPEGERFLLDALQTLLIGRLR